MRLREQPISHYCFVIQTMLIQLVCRYCNNYHHATTPKPPHSIPNYLTTNTIATTARGHGLGLNGSLANEMQVDLLDIPGKGRCCVFIARFAYDPPE